MPTEMPSKSPPPPPNRARLNWIGIGLFAVSAFMFVSIIVKTALRGP